MKCLTTDEIIDLCHRYNIKINGIICRDQLPKQLNEGWYILNMDKASGEGTHWVCFKYSGRNEINLYFDSFGFEPCKELANRIQPFKYNCLKIQSINSSSCGYYVLYCIWFCERYGNGTNALNKFMSLFTEKANTNEKILEHVWINGLKR
jgi:hypothetical protein